MWVEFVWSELYPHGQGPSGMARDLTGIFRGLQGGQGLFRETQGLLREVQGPGTLREVRNAQGFSGIRDGLLNQ